jgi:NAD(P)-dependent dehydrogenase (short-subunit alcohol dehydrogenase family)
MQKRKMKVLRFFIPKPPINYIIMAKQTAIVTGAAGNLGLAVVHHFLENGLNIAATLLPHEHDRVKTFENNPAFQKYELDVTNEEAAQGFVQQVVQKHGSVEVAALLVGGFAMGNLQETNGSQLKKMVELNFESAFYLAKEVFARMAAQHNGGHIFLVGARPALMPDVGKDMMAYALSKSLIFEFAKMLNMEGKKKGIVTSVIVPSTLDTPQNRAAMPDSNFSNWVKPEDVAEIMYFTISEKAKVLREPIIKVYGNS